MSLEAGASLKVELGSEVERDLKAEASSEVRRGSEAEASLEVRRGSEAELSSEVRRGSEAESSSEVRRGSEAELSLEVRRGSEAGASSEVRRGSEAGASLEVSRGSEVELSLEAETKLERDAKLSLLLQAAFKGNLQALKIVARYYQGTAMHVANRALFKNCLGEEAARACACQALLSFLLEQRPRPISKVSRSLKIHVEEALQLAVKRREAASDLKRRELAAVDALADADKGLAEEDQERLPQAEATRQVHRLAHHRLLMNRTIFLKHFLSETAELFAVKKT